MCFSSIRCGRDIMNIQEKIAIDQLSNCFNRASSKVNTTYTEASSRELQLTGRRSGLSSPDPLSVFRSRGRQRQAECWLTSPGLCTCCLSLCHLSDWGRTVFVNVLHGYKTSTERQINLLQITHRSCYIKDGRFMSRYHTPKFTLLHCHSVKLLLLLVSFY